jgi:hypothetical protein
VRSEIAPISSANDADTTIASGHTSHALAMPWVIAMLVAYAPSPRNAAWPRLAMPPKPRMKLRLAAAIE